MSDLVAELAARARALSAPERARLAEELLASLEPADAAVEAAWGEELYRRIEELEQGRVRTISAAEAFVHARGVVGGA